MDIVTLGILSILVFLIYKFYQYPVDYPPGPTGLPIVGYFPFMTARYPAVSLAKLQQKYGDIFSVTLGQHDCIVVSNYDYMKKLLSDNACAFLPKLNIIYLGGGRHIDGEPKGIIFSEYETWQTMRKSIVTYLKNISSEELHALQKEEFDYLENRLKGIEGDAPKLFHEVHKTAIRIVYRRLIIDKDMDNLDWDKITVGATQLMESEVADVVLVNFLKFMLYVFILLKVDKNIPVGKYYEYLMELSQNLVQQHLHKEAGGSPEDVVDLLLKDLNKLNEKIPVSTLKQVQYTLVTLVYTSGHNIVAIFTWFLLRLQQNPHVKKKVYEEIEANFSATDATHVDDKEKIPYTFAALMETYRLGMLFPTTLRRTEKEFHIAGYRIPTNTCVIFNNYAVMVDPKNYEDPMSFKPERFLGEGGLERLDTLKLKFGCGKRTCPALVSAAGDTFCIAVDFLRRYNYEIKEDLNTLDKDPVAMPPKYTAQIFPKIRKS